MAISTQALIALGGSRWQKAGKDRIYFNNLSELYGLELEYYHSGNVSGAWLDGEKISNGAGSGLQATFAGAKFYYNVQDGEFYSTGLGQGAHDRLASRIRARVGQQTETPQAPEQPLPEGYVKADCGHVISKSQLMNANLGQTCLDCYDRWSE